MDSSRIFVRGLPPNITTEEFHRHFSKDTAVTDVKFIPKRRIGYVGFKTSADAANAVRYHNKSFIRMSRIGVELARSIEVQHASKTSKVVSNAIPRSSRNITEEPDVGTPKKRKLDVMDNKLKEYLEVMQPPSKVAAWSKEETNTIPQSPRVEGLGRGLGFDEGQSDEEYVAIDRRGKLGVGPVPSESAIGRPNQLATEAQQLPAEGTGSAEASVECANPAMSDEDWIRSRTSRLLGLGDDDDAQAARSLPINAVPISANVLSQEPSIQRRISDTCVQTNEMTQHEVQIKDASPVPTQENCSTQTNRLFIRNLAYTTTENDLRGLFDSHKYGHIEEVHLPRDHRTGSGKGYAYVQFSESDAAQRAIEELDGKVFQGRLLHIIPADPKIKATLDDFTASKLPLKKQRQIKQRTAAVSTTFNWNSMFMNTDAVMSSISDRLGVSKSELLDATSSGAAIKQAHAETHVIQDAKEYFSVNGVDLDSFKRKDRGETALLVKNFPYDMKAEDLQTLFSGYGSVSKLLVPPSGTIAIVEFDQAEDARAAFRGLAYRKVKDSILFLEKAPRGLFAGASPREGVTATKVPAPLVMEHVSEKATANVATLFVRNLNFSTTTDRLREVFKPVDGFLSARVKMKPHPKKPGQSLSMGFGFLEFHTKQQAEAALAAMDGYNLDGHQLLIRSSHKALDAAEERRKDDQAKKMTGKKTKVIIKNLPFEVTKRDVRSLFEAYGALRSVRVPKKLDMSTRGFAFAEFVTAKEAENAMSALRDTHLLGRRLILEFAAEEAVDPEQEIADMQRKVGKQADKVALQQLYTTGTARKKFNVETDELQSG